MAQLHFYVPEELAEKIRKEAHSAGMSVSRYLATLVKHEIALDWPEDFFEEVVGGWMGEPLERSVQDEFENRELLNLQ